MKAFVLMLSRFIFLLLLSPHSFSLALSRIFCSVEASFAFALDRYMRSAYDIAYTAAITLCSKVQLKNLQTDES